MSAESRTLRAVGPSADRARLVLRAAIARARQNGWPPEQLAVLERTRRAFVRQRRWQGRAS